MDRSSGILLCLLALPGLMYACATTPDESPFATEGRIWPDPPDPPRIAFVKAFTRPADLGIRPGIWDRLVSVVAGAPDDAMVRPMDVVATTGGGMIYVADPDARCVHRFDLQRNHYDCLRLSRDESLGSPIGLAITPAGRLFVADSLLRGIFTIEAGDRYLQRLDTGEALQQPTGIAWDEDAGVLFVTDTGAQSIKAFTPEGEQVLGFGERGADPGQLNFPTYLWLPGDGELVVTDSLNFRIQRFATSGEFLHSFGKNGDQIGDFARPKGVAVDALGHIYVVDALFNGVQIFDREGMLLLAFGEQGQGPGQFWLPNGIHVTRDNMIFVADSYNRRVQVLRYIGTET
jgi:sugar lactone lactonase YvrE